jgi:thiol-disulfide isomerase/thioredoxin
MKYWLLAAFLVCHGSIPDVSAATSGPQVGSTAPEFVTKNLVTGETVDLNAQRGKLVILTFWATWCAPCRRELPILERAQEYLGKDRLLVLAVNFRDSDDAQRSLRRFAKSWRISVLRDAGGRIASSYNIKAIPHLFMIDGDGKVVANHTGYGDKSLVELVADINDALGAKAPAGEPSEPVPGEPPPTGAP